MSVVSGVTLICRLGETGNEDPNVYDNDGDLLRIKLNDLLKKLDRNCEFTELSEQYGGNKHPQHLIFGAGINFLDEDRFIEAVMNWKWKDPTNMILIVQPEDGPTRVFRLSSAPGA